METVKNNKLLQCVGRDEQHLSALPNHNGIKIHSQVIAPLLELMSAAKQEGFELRVASGYRSFERQRLIWNQKCLGLRPTLNNDGQVIDIHQLSPLEKIKAIMRWSALPGSSRHHWGTDFDIYDASAMPDDYQLQLHPDEYSQDGLFGPMMTWLTSYLASPVAPDFYRPYLQDSGGVAPELWHLSYRPIAKEYMRHMSQERVLEHLQHLPSEHKIEEQQTVINHLPFIYSRYLHCS